MPSSRSPSAITAVSSMSGYLSFSNSKAHPPGVRSGRRTAGAGADLAQLEVRMPDRAQRTDDRQRNEGLPSPAGEVVDRERSAGRQQDQLRRNRNDSLPRPLAEEGHEALREDAAARNAPFA